MGSHLGQPSRAAISGQASRGKPSRAATSGQAISGQASRAAASGRPYRASISGSHLEQPSRAVISGQAFRGKHGGAAISASHIGQPSRTTMSGSHPGEPARAAILGKSANPNTTLEAAALAAAMAPQRKEPASGKWKEEMEAWGCKKSTKRKSSESHEKWRPKKGSRAHVILLSGPQNQGRQAAPIWVMKKILQAKKNASKVGFFAGQP